MLARNISMLRVRRSHHRINGQAASARQRQLNQRVEIVRAHLDEIEMAGRADVTLARGLPALLVAEGQKHDRRQHLHSR